MTISPERLNDMRRYVAAFSGSTESEEGYYGAEYVRALLAEVARLAAALAEERAKVAEAERKGAERAWDEGSNHGYESAMVAEHIWVTDDDPNPYRADQVRGEQP